MSNNIIWVIGTGPGAKEYLTQAAINKIKEQDLLAGSRKALELFSYLNKETYVFERDIDSLKEFLKTNIGKKKIGVLVTGDPGIYSLANTLKNYFEPGQLRFLPGISSVQLFFARLGFSYEDVKILSVHGRQITDLIKKIKLFKRVCILTDTRNNPQKIAQALLAQSIKARAWIGQNISLPEEQVVAKDIEELSQNGEYPNSLLYLEIEEKV